MRASACANPWYGSAALPLQRVPAASHHPGQGQLAPLRHVQIGGNQKSGPAFEDYFFDAVCVAIQHSRDAGVERRLLRHRAEALARFIADGGDVALGIAPGLERLLALQARLLRAPNALDKVLLHHARESIERRRSGGGVIGPAGG